MAKTSGGELATLFGLDLPEQTAKRFKVILPIANRAHLSRIMTWIIEEGFEFEMRPREPRQRTAQLSFEDEVEAQATADRWA